MVGAWVNVTKGYPDGEGLVEAASESIEVAGVGLCGGVRVGTSKEDSASVVNHCIETLVEEAVRVSESGGNCVWEVGGYAM